MVTATSLIVIVAGLVLQLPSPSPTDAAAALTFGDIPNVVFVRYDVRGRSPAAIRTSINAARPTDPNDAKRVDGLSRSFLEWSWREIGEGRGNKGRCLASADDVRFSATVTIPRLVDPSVSPSVRAHFERYRQSLLDHEEGHVRYVWEHRGEVVAAINAAGCAGAGAAALTAFAGIAAHDVAYDKATDHGASTILPFG